MEDRSSPEVPGNELLTVGAEAPPDSEGFCDG